MHLLTMMMMMNIMRMEKSCNREWIIIKKWNVLYTRTKWFFWILCKTHKIVFLFFLIKQSRIKIENWRQNKHLSRVEYENSEIAKQNFIRLMDEASRKVVHFHRGAFVCCSCCCRRCVSHSKVSISQKQRNLHSKYLFRHTRSCSLESSC